jgi:hypothetical protein
MSGHRVHDNFIIDQKGEGMLLGQYMTGENWVYNNVIARAGLGPERTDGIRGMNHIGVQIDMGIRGGPPTTLYFNNNTIFGCGWSGAARGPAANGAIAFDNLGQYKLVFARNLIVSTGQPFLAVRQQAPAPLSGLIPDRCRPVAYGPEESHRQAEHAPFLRLLPE